MSGTKLIANSAQNQEALRSLLNQGGFRLTAQRQKILNVFNDHGQEHHLDACRIYQELRLQGESISYSTIYRTVHVMVELGLLRELELAEGRKSYELNSPFASQHYHLVCTVCGAIEEFESEAIDKISSIHVEAHRYWLLDRQFTLYGICRCCQNVDSAI